MDWENIAVNHFLEFLFLTGTIANKDE